MPVHELLRCTLLALKGQRTVSLARHQPAYGLPRDLEISRAEKTIGRLNQKPKSQSSPLCTRAGIILAGVSLCKDEAMLQPGKKRSWTAPQKPRPHPAQGFQAARECERRSRLRGRRHDVGPWRRGLERTVANLNAADHLTEKPALRGSVVAVALDAKHRFSKTSRLSIILTAGHGVEGDAHYGRFVRHRYLAHRKPQAPNLRQVHLIPNELFNALRKSGYDVSPGDLGENITTRDSISRRCRSTHSFASAVRRTFGSPVCARPASSSIASSPD
jgi:hypothetical protein